MSMVFDNRHFAEQVIQVLKNGELTDIPIVLIVEDSITISGIIKKAFESKGYRADIALNALDAQKYFGETSYDVAIIDYHLPDNMGDTLIDIFHKDRPDCIILMMTSDSTPELALDWIKRGAAAYIRKPFEPEYLINLCAKAIHERSLSGVHSLLEIRTRELKESEERYRLIVETSNEGIWVMDKDHITTYANEAMAEMLGYRPSEIIGKKVEDFFFAEDMAFHNDKMRKRHDGRDEIYERRFKRKDGSELWTLVSAKALKNSDGGFSGSFGMFTDITERKGTRQALQESEKKYRDIINSIVDIVYIFSNLRGSLFFSPSVETVLGYPMDYLFANPFLWNESIHPEDKERVRQVIVEAGIGKPFAIEYRIRDAHGNWLWFHDSSITESSSGGEIFIKGIARDITEKKKMEEELHLTKYSIDSIVDGLFWVDKSSRFLFVNNAACKNLGYSREEMLTMNVFDIDIRFPKEKWEEHWEQISHPGNFFLVETIHQAKDGREIPIEVSSSMVEYGGKQYNCGVTRDITARKLEEQAREKLQAQLNQAQKMESIGRLAGGVAHDLNNMLSVIIGNVEMAMYDIEPSQPGFNELDEIRKAAERSANLTRQLLAFARKQTIAPKVLDLNETVKDMLKMLERIIGEDIDLQWQPKDDLWKIKFDPSQIDQILANLCVNARDAINGVGKLTIKTDNIIFKKAFLPNNPELVTGNYVLLSVSDSGSGMDKNTLENIFEPFFTTKELGKGTGLGLSMVYGIVKQNNGLITVESEPGQGATFNIYLPRHTDKSEQIRNESLPIQELVCSGSETILLVEDEPSILKLTKMMLEKQGYKVLAASKPGEAMDMAENHSGTIDLLMTDVVMPEMNGRDLAKNILSIYPDIKRLFMSGYTADVIARHGVLDAGVHFIQKPFSKQQLLSKVKDALDCLSHD